MLFSHPIRDHKELVILSLRTSIAGFKDSGPGKSFVLISSNQYVVFELSYRATSKQVFLDK